MYKRTVASIAGYSLVALLTLDTCARIDDAFNEGAPFLAPYNINALFQPSEFGREGKPGARFGKWSINSLGYRGPEPDPSGVNILTFGASETFGLYEDVGNEYPRVLERLLNANGAARFNVINIALPGVRIGRIGYLTNGIKRTSAKVVIIYSSPSNYIGMTEPLCGKPTFRIPDATSIVEYFRISGKLEMLLKKTLPAQVLTLLREFSIWQYSRTHEVIERVPDSTISAFAADLECAGRATQASGAKVIFATHATYFGSKLMPSDSAMMTSWRRFYPELRESGFIDLEERANASIVAVASKLGANFIDVREHVQGGTKNFADFVHFTNAGAASMATTLSPMVLDALSR